MRYSIRISLAACVLALCRLSIAQELTTAVLKIEVENFARYDNDVTDYSKLATLPTPTAPMPVVNFGTYNLIGDIVAINGTPVQGTLMGIGRTFLFSSNPAPGQIHGDTRGSPFYEFFYDIMRLDGGVIGSISSQGFANGPPSPGAPAALAAGRGVVVGGSGAFLGIRGQEGLAAGGAGGRRASVSEDPSMRRTYGGSKITIVQHVIPTLRPEILITDDGPAVVHASDFSPVTAANPAISGEILTVFASGLGPTRPGTDPGQAFTSDPLQVVNSPVAITLNGASAEVLYAGGYPGSVDAYQVNFSVPPGLTAGPASLRIVSAWMPGPEVRIDIQ